MSRRPVYVSFDYHYLVLFGEGPDKELKQIPIGIRVIDGDPIALGLVYEIETLFVSVLLDKADDKGSVVDRRLEKEAAPQLAAMFRKLTARLEEINDGSYKVRDLWSKQIRWILNGEYYPGRRPHPFIRNEW